MFNAEREVFTSLEDVVEITGKDGTKGLELHIGVGGNDEDAVKEKVNEMTSRAKELGLEYEVGDANSKKRGNGKTFVSNWGSGSAWKNSKNN